MYKKYLLIDEVLDIVESKDFLTDEFEIGDDKSIWIYEENQLMAFVGYFSMESDDYDELDLYRRLNGYSELI